MVHVLYQDQLNAYDVLVNDDVVFTSAALASFVGGPLKGEVSVTITEDTSFLRGPSVLLAHGELAAEWWHENEGNSDASR